MANNKFVFFIKPFAIPLSRLEISTNRAVSLSLRRRQHSAIYERLLEIYHGKSPRFDKAAIRDLAEQLENVAIIGSGTISIRDFENKVVNFEFDAITEMEEFLEKQPGELPDGVEVYLQRFEISYLSIQELFSLARDNPDAGLCSYRPQARFGFRDIDTRDHIETLFNTELNLQTVKTLLVELCSRFDNGPFWAEIKQQLQTKAEILSKIDNIIMIGAGSMVPYKGGSFGKLAATQFALIRALKEMIEGLRHQPHSVKAYSQEIRAHEHDRRALASLNIEHVHDPEGFLRVDDNSAVVAICAHVCYTQIILDFARPVMFFIDDTPLEPDEPSSLTAPHVLKRTKVEEGTDNAGGEDTGDADGASTSSSSGKASFEISADPRTPRTEAILTEEYYRIPVTVDINIHSDDSGGSAEPYFNSPVIFIRKH